MNNPTIALIVYCVLLALMIVVFIYYMIKECNSVSINALHFTPPKPPLPSAIAEKKVRDEGLWFLVLYAGSETDRTLIAANDILQMEYGDGGRLKLCCKKSNGHYSEEMCFNHITRFEFLPALSLGGDLGDDLKEKTCRIEEKMIQIQTWMDSRRILVVDELGHGSVQVCIPNADVEDNRFQGKADALVYALWTDEKFRGRGVARRLLEAAEREARSLGCRSICLEWDGREADGWTFGWYERLGYEEMEFSFRYSLMVKKL